ncbi:MAG: hypothetical protein M1817_005350 [Caeruleum heppii]|nr:MAG: hypothetical protein M1817_005350 [Caeruleum heppii]
MQRDRYLYEHHFVQRFEATGDSSNELESPRNGVVVRSAEEAERRRLDGHAFSPVSHVFLFREANACVISETVRVHAVRGRGPVTEMEWSATADAIVTAGLLMRVGRLTGAVGPTTKELRGWSASRLWYLRVVSLPWLPMPTVNSQAMTNRLREAILTDILLIRGDPYSPVDVWRATEQISVPSWDAVVH